MIFDCRVRKLLHFLTEIILKTHKNYIQQRSKFISVNVDNYNVVLNALYNSVLYGYFPTI
ncbi:hypothetical protein DRF62_10355 [Chryseobacterium piscium]|uniref:Uncharacterized protein n=1 Tax=Chryseobacterium piscium TaxID=333702 RepID=A0A3D9BL09_9FLAO|nr:hypothetical protein DRF62_10355 [Chryseobacterium piscium]